jgi:hypothetical protein
MKIYVPSYLGDISLEAMGEKSKIIYKNVTAGEKSGLEKFLKIYHLDVAAAGESEIPEEINKAHKKFIRIFKRGRPTINAVKLKDGKIEIVQNFPKDAEAGVTMEKPPKGCPMPVWEKAELQAQEVLRVFLNPQQWADFEQHRSFVCHGNYTGHPYLLTSRWNPLCQTMGVLHSLAEHRRICAGMDTVPPAEELLAFKIMIECNEKQYVYEGLNPN